MCMIFVNSKIPEFIVLIYNFTIILALFVKFNFVAEEGPPSYEEAVNSGRIFNGMRKTMIINFFHTFA